ncbi:DNA-3-methyladenine glycosylase 2 family protein [Fimbriimonas ginsengisoli]|uniref:DNA-3-methyladenine glycosylase II n=1 Tax=Fimbriimonas ginsengisoli Gsoil 348 TaxID=661478 RepID=A0A068NJF0_FIMGI|nr:Ada metal-binding domain-containing protein [Fimbriimonas ginsengisoli]AIE83552.1 AraC family transcriptional regulator [Fimbriimonas ginsengisoli Gsoil 348]
MRLTREVMLDRMAASDPAFNGRFIVGVHSTGIYCLPSCRARRPKPENVRFYDSIEAAREAGLRACKKCRPDDWAQGIDADRDRLAAVLATMWESPGRFRGIEDLAREAVMSPSVFFTAVRNQYQSTPGALLTSARVRQARRLLQSGGEVGAVGQEVGFESSSAYYENFGRRTGMPPAAYQRLAGRTDFAVELPDDFAPTPLFHYLGRDPNSLTERLTDEGVDLSVWAGEVPCRISLSVSGQSMRVCIDADRPVDVFAVHHQVSRLLGLEQDPRAFEEHVRGLGYGRLIEGREGMRIPLTPTPFDALVWCIVGQQVNLPFAFALRRRLSEKMAIPVGAGMFAPPTAEWLATRELEEFVPLQYSRRKAEYLVGAAQSVVEGRLDLETLSRAPRSEIEKTLLAQRGIGPWAANYLMMRALGSPDCVPVGDTGITTALGRFFDVARPGPEETLRLLEPFRPYRSYACYHLWQTLHKSD